VPFHDALGPSEPAIRRLAPPACDDPALAHASMQHRASYPAILSRWGAPRTGGAASALLVLHQLLAQPAGTAADGDGGDDGFLDWIGFGAARYAVILAAACALAIVFCLLKGLAMAYLLQIVSARDFAAHGLGLRCIQPPPLDEGSRSSSAADVAAASVNLLPPSENRSPRRTACCPGCPLLIAGAYLGFASACAVRLLTQWPSDKYFHEATTTFNNSVCQQCRACQVDLDCTWNPECSHENMCSANGYDYCDCMRQSNDGCIVLCYTACSACESSQSSVQGGLGDSICGEAVVFWANALCLCVCCTIALQLLVGMLCGCASRLGT
jgi:hypothetical protein